MFRVNVMGTVLPTQVVVPHMIELGKGKIVNVSSKAAVVGEPYHAAYSASKGAVLALTRALAIELAPYGIRVNMLTPGLNLTRLTSDFDVKRQKRMKADIPMRRPGNPEELGASAVLLLSDRLSSYTTGSELVVDGGLKLRPLPLFSDEVIRNLNLSEEQQA